LGTRERGDGGLDTLLEYSTDLFEAGTAERFLGHFGTILRSAARDPQQRIGDLQILTEAELRTLTEDWNATARAPAAGTLQELVAVCMERVPELLVALLGVLKTGAAYVPVDPTYPADRQAFMLTDASARVIVTQESLLLQLPPHDATPVCLDRDRDEIAQLSA